MDSRVDLLNVVCAHYPQPRYLEIGCRYDECFGGIHAPVKVGVDPEWGGTHRMTSDEYFAGCSDTFDVVFVDGLHFAEQVRVDVENSLEHLSERGVIVLHDCLPDNEWHQDPQRARDLIAAGDTQLHGIGEWCGDVWRVLVELNNRRDIDVALWPGDHGCGLATRRPSPGGRWQPAFSVYRAMWERRIARIDDEKGLHEWLTASS